MFLKKLQKQPQGVKKVFIWFAAVAIGLILFFFWVMDFREKTSVFQKEKFIKELNFPSFQKESDSIKNFYEKIENNEDILKFKELMKRIEEERKNINNR